LVRKVGAAKTEVFDRSVVGTDCLRKGTKSRFRKWEVCQIIPAMGKARAYGKRESGRKGIGKAAPRRRNVSCRGVGADPLESRRFHCKRKRGPKGKTPQRGEREGRAV